jgi:hypothetical protein
MIFEKDLGEATTEAAAMMLFDPDPSWKRIEEEAAEQVVSGMKPEEEN